MSGYNITATLTAIDNFSSVFQRAGQAVQSFGSAAQSHLSGVGKATMAAGAATTAMGIAGVKSFGDFQQSLNTAAVVAGGTSKDIGGLADVANRMGAELPLSANESAQAMVNMARNGASLNDIKKEFPAIAKASTAAGEDINTTAGVVQEAMNIWGNSLQSPQQAAAILVQTANASNASIGDMQQAMATIGPTANMAGMSMQDTSTAIGLLTNKGFSAAQASDDLNHAITQMLAPSSMAKKEMDKLGLSFTDANGSMKPLPQILQEVAQKTDGMGQAQKEAALKTMFGMSGMKAIAPLLDAVKDKTGNTSTSWDAFAKSVDNAAGTTAKAEKTLNSQAAEMQKNMGAKIEQVGGNWESLRNKALASKGGVTDSMLDMTNKTLEWATTSNSSTAEAIRGFVGLAPAIGPAVTAVGGFITNFGKITDVVGKGITAFGNMGKSTVALIRAFSGIKGGVEVLQELSKSSTIAKVALAGYNAVVKIGTAVQAAFDAVMAMNPFVLVVAAIAAVVTALVLFFTKTKEGQRIWQEFTKFLNTAWKNIKTAAIETWTQISNQLKQMWQGIVNTGKTIWNGLKTFFMTIWNGVKSTTTSIWNGIKVFFTTTWNGIKNTAMTVFNVLKTFFMTVWNGVKSTSTTVWNGIKNTLTTIWNGLKAVATVAFNAVKIVVTTAWNNVKAVTTGVWNAIKGSLSAVWNGIKSAASGSFNAIKSTIQGVWDGIKSITSGIWNAIKSLLTGNWNGLKSSSNSIFNGIHQVISSIWNGIKGVTSSVWNGIKSALSGIWNSISSAASSTWNNIKSNITSAVSNMASNVTSKAKNMMSRFVNAVQSGGSHAIREAGRIGRNVVSSIRSGLSNLRSVAENAMQGFVNGVIHMGNEAIHAAEHIAHNIVSTIQSALDIHSPSRVMRDEVGVWVPAGVAVGMEDNIGTVSDAAKSVSDAAMVKVPKADTTNFTQSLRAIKSASSDAINGMEVDGKYQVQVDKQPAHIQLTMGTSTFNGFVGDISKQQGNAAQLTQAYSMGN